MANKMEIIINEKNETKVFLDGEEVKGLQFVRFEQDGWNSIPELKIITNPLAYGNGKIYPKSKPMPVSPNEDDYLFNNTELDYI